MYARQLCGPVNRAGVLLATALMLLRQAVLYVKVIITLVRTAVILAGSPRSPVCVSALTHSMCDMLLCGPCRHA